MESQTAYLEKKNLIQENFKLRIKLEEKEKEIEGLREKLMEKEYMEAFRKQVGDWEIAKNGGIWRAFRTMRSGKIIAIHIGKELDMERAKSIIAQKEEEMGLGTTIM